MNGQAVPFRRCSLCGARMEPGEPRWEHHRSHGHGTVIYCAECVIPHPYRQRQAARQLVEQWKQSVAAGRRGRGR